MLMLWNTSSLCPVSQSQVLEEYVVTVQYQVEMVVIDHMGKEIEIVRKIVHEYRERGNNFRPLPRLIATELRAVSQTLKLIARFVGSREECAAAPLTQQDIIHYNTGNPRTDLLPLLHFLLPPFSSCAPSMLA